MAVAMSIEELHRFLAEVFPQVKDDFYIEDLGEALLSVRLCVTEKHLRPGGTVAGPAMFALADVAAYLMILARVGPKALAVTSNAGIDFLRKPAANCDLVAECRLLKLGKSLATCDTLIYSQGVAQPVARANLTYSIPQDY